MGVERAPAAHILEEAVIFKRLCKIKVTWGFEIQLTNEYREREERTT